MDVHSKQSVFTVQNEAGEVIGEGVVATSLEGFVELRQRHSLAPGTAVGLETGTVSFFAARKLAEVGLRPVVIDAHEVRLKAHRPKQKCDRRDAFEICDGLRRDIYRVKVYVPPVEISRLRETLSRRRHFVRVRSSEVHAAKRLLRAEGLGSRSRSLGTERGWTKLLESLDASSPLHLYLSQHFALWRCAQEQVVALEKLLSNQVEPFREQIARLMAIPSIGPITAATFVATFGDVSRFPTAKHAASYVGLAPSMYQSGVGKAAHFGRITKRGSIELRALLSEAAHLARRPNSPFHPYFRALCARRGYRSAIIALAHRLCRIMYAMLRDGKAFDLGRLNVECGPFERTRVELYRLKKVHKHALPIRK